MTYSGKTKISRREVIDHAKRAVLTFGSDNILDHAEECIGRDHAYDDGFPVAEVAEEAVRQAERVYAFLGYSRCSSATGVQKRTRTARIVKYA